MNKHKTNLAVNGHWVLPGIVTRMGGRDPPCAGGQRKPRLGCSFSYNSCIVVHSNLTFAPVFVGK